MAQRELVPGVHLFTSSAWQMTSLVAFLGPEGRGPGRQGREGERLVVDPGYFPDELAQQAALLTLHGERQPVGRTTLLLTHGDFDHVVGGALLPAGTAVLGHAALRRRRAERLARQIEGFDRPLYVERPAPFAFPYPTDPVRGPEVRELGDERLHLFPAPGHTRDSLFTILERRGLFLAGDYLSDLEFPFVDDSVPRYLATLDLATELAADFQPRLLVPGHGPVAETAEEMRDRIGRDRDYLLTLAEGVEAAVRAGCDLREARRRLAHLSYRGRPIPDHLLGYHQANVARAYRALAQPRERRRRP